VILEDFCRKASCFGGDGMVGAGEVGDMVAGVLASAKRVDATENYNSDADTEKGITKPKNKARFSTKPKNDFRSIFPINRTDF
jgi:hypothetical protein